MIWSFWSGVTGAVVTVSDLITAALQRLMVLSAGEVATADDLALGLDRLNDLLDSLANESLLVTSLTRTTWTLTTATSYSVGSGGDVNIDRPVSPNAIEAIGYVDNSLTPPLEILFGPPLTEAAYQAIPQKTLTGTYPTQWYYNPTFPLGALKPYPVVSGSSLLGVLYTSALVSQFAATSDLVALPPGWRKFLRDSLAVEMAPDLGVAVPPSVAESAETSRALIKRVNVRPSDLSTREVAQLFSASGGGYDINSDS